MFKNEKIRGVHVSRYIMSWVRSGGQLSSIGEGYDNFSDWLKTLDLSENERDCILDLAKCGKMEFEVSAKSFIKNMKVPIL